ncbi:MAG: hypothetical protein NW217_06485 [Hyphomicrobiaceae bacterium]|nr:hypothetical protein [Hyphomicrobiaceae bacterium]
MKTLLYWAVGIAVALVVAFNILTPTYMFRYRLSLSAVVDGNVITGSAVQESRIRLEPKILPEQQGATTRVVGEAVVVDLGDRGKLFALLKMDEQRIKPQRGIEAGSPDYDWLALAAFDMTKGAPGALRWQKMNEFIGEQRALVADRIPLLVRFRDISDPLTIERVDPENLARSFGIGVYLKEARIEIVDAGIWPLNRWGFTGEPVTMGIEEVLPWISWPRDRLLAHGRGENPLRMPNQSPRGYLTLSTTSFSKE